MSSLDFLLKHLPRDVALIAEEYAGGTKFGKVQISTIEKVRNFLFTFFTLGFGNANNNKAYKDALSANEWKKAAECIKKGATIDESAWLDYAVENKLPATKFLIAQLSEKEKKSLTGRLTRAAGFGYHPRAYFPQGEETGYYNPVGSDEIFEFDLNIAKELRKILL